MKRKICVCVCTAAMLFSMCAIPQAEAKASDKKVYVTKGSV